MKGKSVKGNVPMLLLLFLLLLLFTGAVTAVQGAEVESVTREAPRYSAPEEKFDVTLKINGEPPLTIWIFETIPEGFTFEGTTHPFFNQSKSDPGAIFFAVIDKSEIPEIKYTVMAPPSSDEEGTSNGIWSDLLNEEGKVEEKIADTTVTVRVGGEIVGGGSSAKEEVTPTPFVPTVTKAIRVVPVLEAGKEVAMVFKDMDVSMIALKADKNVSNVMVEVERIDKPSDIPAPSSVSYAYLDIKVENVGGAKIDGKIEFKVAKSWVADNNIDEATVRLNRYDGGGWKALPTSKTGEDNATVYFEAETTGFSTFAITGEKKVVVDAAATPIPTSTPASAAVPATIPSPTPAPASEVPGFEAIFIAVSLLAAYLLVFGKRGKGGDME